MARIPQRPVFRAAGIPKGDDAKGWFQDILKELLHADEHTIKPVFTLSNSCTDRNALTAILAFEPRLPRFLLDVATKKTERFVWRGPFSDSDDGDWEITIDANFYGLTQLYETKKESPIIADIVAVTGLAGHAYGSWRSKSYPYNVWLREYLRTDLPECRTMIFGYDTKLGSNGTQTTLDYTRDLVEALKTARETKEEQMRPIIFIGYSYGGIVIVQTIIRALRAQRDDRFSHDLMNSCYATLFFGTPHRGLLIDDLSQIAKSKHKQALLDSISSENTELDKVVEEFQGYAWRLKIVSFYEGQPQKRLQQDEDGIWSRTGEMLEDTAVDYSSSVLGTLSGEEKVPINKNHSDMVKFEDKSTDYPTVARYLRGFSDELRGKVVVKKEILGETAIPTMPAVTASQTPSSSPDTLASTHKPENQDKDNSAASTDIALDSSSLEVLPELASPKPEPQNNDNPAGDTDGSNSDVLELAQSNPDDQEGDSSTDHAPHSSSLDIALAQPQSEKDDLAGPTDLELPESTPGGVELPQSNSEGQENGAVVSADIPLSSPKESEKKPEIDILPLSSLRVIWEPERLQLDEEPREVASIVPTGTGGYQDTANINHRVDNSRESSSNAQDSSQHPSDSINQLPHASEYATVLFPVSDHFPRRKNRSLPELGDEDNGLGHGSPYTEFQQRIGGLASDRLRPIRASTMSVVGDTDRFRDQPQERNSFSYSYKPFGSNSSRAFHHEINVMPQGRPQSSMIDNLPSYDLAAGIADEPSNYTTAPSPLPYPIAASGNRGMQTLSNVGTQHRISSSSRFISQGSLLSEKPRTSPPDIPIRPKKGSSVSAGPGSWRSTKLSKDLPKVGYSVDGNFAYDRRGHSFRGRSEGSGNGKYINLHQASLDGDLSLVNRLLSAGSSVDLMDAFGNTPLHYAASQGHLLLATSLAKYGANLEAEDRDGSRPLHLAIEFGRVKMVEWLVSNECNISAPGRSKATPLHFAAAYAGEEILRVFLPYMHSLECLRDSEGHAPLHVAALGGNKEFLGLFLSSGCQGLVKSRDGDTALHLAAQNGHTEAVELLSHHIPLETLNQHERTPLLEAVCGGHEAVINLLMGVGARMSTSTALHLAVIHYRLWVAEKLLQNGADISCKDRYGLTPLHKAAEVGKKRMIELLLSFNANINARGDRGQTPLHLAAYSGNEGVVRLLIQKGVDWSIRGKLGSTPLHSAAYSGVVGIAGVLISCGVSIEARTTPDHHRALHIAAANNNSTFVGFLLDSSADIEAMTAEGDTALHIAAGLGNDRVVSLLLSRGASIHTVNGKRQTALDLAKQNKRNHTIALLEDSLTYDNHDYGSDDSSNGPEFKPWHDVEPPPYQETPKLARSYPVWTSGQIAEKCSRIHWIGGPRGLGDGRNDHIDATEAEISQQRRQ